MPSLYSSARYLHIQDKLTSRVSRNSRIRSGIFHVFKSLEPSVLHVRLPEETSAVWRSAFPPGPAAALFAGTAVAVAGFTDTASGNRKWRPFRVQPKRQDGDKRCKKDIHIGNSSMENQVQKKVYLHYDHTDPCKYARWTARESYHFMYARPWRRVSEFYSDVVNGRFSLFYVFGAASHFSTKNSTQDGDEILEACEEMKAANVRIKDRTGRWARVTFKIVLAYHGGSFDGWQKQPGLNTVQGLVEKSLGRFVDERKAQQLKERSIPIEGSSLVAGRTDKGVTALQQVCSFYTWRMDVKCGEIEDAINNAAPEKLKVISVSKVSREFHPNFSAKWRRYFYIFPLNCTEKEECDENERARGNNSPYGNYEELKRELTEHVEENGEFITGDDEDELDSRNKPRSFSVSMVNQLLQRLEGKSLSYKMFARDTKASRSTGPPTECFVYHARAAEAKLPSAEEENAIGLSVMCVELVANRFLRKMVRVLVATAIREAAAGADCDTLLRLMAATCRRATAPPAPPDGLCLVDVGYQEFKQEDCLIL